MHFASTLGSGSRRIKRPELAGGQEQHFGERYDRMKQFFEKNGVTTRM